MKLLLSLGCAAIAAITTFSWASASLQDAPPKPADKPAPEKPAPPVYDEKADAATDIAAALAHAKAENRRVLIQWGGNWCGWCIKLHGLMKSDAKISRKLLYEYDVVKVDIGHWDKHMDLAEKYGAKLKDTGVPYLTVLDGDGKVLVNQDSGILEIKDPPSHDPQKVLEFLTRYQADYHAAKDVLAGAVANANAQNKRVFLHFGAPWCGWCHRLEGWMAQPAIASILAKEFVDLKIDTDRTVGGQDLLTQYCPTPQGIPWIVFLDDKGAVLASSTYGDGKNTGFPSEDQEIAHFVTMLEKSCKVLSKNDIAALRESLIAEREKTKH